MFKNTFAATLNFKSCAKLFSKTQLERRGSEDWAPPQQGLGRASSGSWQGSRSCWRFFSSFLPVVPLVRILAGFSPLLFPLTPHKWRRRNAESPQVTLALWVHGSACFAAKVLWEVTRVGYGADDSEPGRAVRIRDDALVRAFRCPGGAPHLQAAWASTMWKKWLWARNLQQWDVFTNFHSSLSVEGLYWGKWTAFWWPGWLGTFTSIQYSCGLTAFIAKNSEGFISSWISIVSTRAVAFHQIVSVSFQ